MRNAALLLNITGIQDVSYSRTKRIVVLGDGLAGIFTTTEIDKAVSRKPELEITLIGRQNLSLFTSMLHEVATSWSRA